jgi:hypothetical protein
MTDESPIAEKPKLCLTVNTVSMVVEVEPRDR